MDRTSDLYSLPPDRSRSPTLRLPTLTVAGMALISRLAWIQRDGVIEQVVYPVFPPDRNGAEILDRVRAIRSADGS